MIKNVLLIVALSLLLPSFLVELTGDEQASSPGSISGTPVAQAQQQVPLIQQAQPVMVQSGQWMPSAQQNQALMGQGMPMSGQPSSGVQPYPPSMPQTMPMAQGGQSMSMGMGCGGMGGMGHQMGGMSMGAGGMAHNMEQGLSMREILYVLSMQDAVQAITDLIQIQEKLLEAVNMNEKEALGKEMERLKERAKKLSSDYRGMITSQIRSE